MSMKLSFLKLKLNELFDKVINYKIKIVIKPFLKKNILWLVLKSI
jgi:hypothetical protein